MRALPTGWTWTRFANVAVVRSNLVDPKRTPNAPHVAPNHIESWTTQLLPFATVAEDKVTSGKHAFFAGQILYSKIRPYLAKVVMVDFDGLCSADMYPIESRIESRYLLRWMASPEFTELASQSQGRTVLPKINQDALNRLPVPVPPLNEQRRIVAKIDAFMARSRRAKESLDAIPPLLERLRQSILAAAFRGDLTADWRAQNPDVEPAEKLLERIETPPRPPRYASRSVAVLPGDAALSVGNPDTPTPPGWRWVPLVDVARLESGHTPSRRQPEWWGGDVPWISLKDAGWRHGRTIFETRETTNELGLANSAARVLPEGTVCLSRTGTIGYSTVMGRPMATSQDFANWVCTEAVNPHWLKHLFAAERHALHQFSAQTTNIATIYYPELISFHVCLPPIAEQDEIVRRVEKAMSQLDAARKAHAGGTRRVAELDRAILAKAFRGELVPQDPNDEPAEHMLARLANSADTTPVKRKRGRQHKG